MAKKPVARAWTDLMELCGGFRDVLFVETEGLVNMGFFSGVVRSSVIVGNWQGEFAVNGIRVGQQALGLVVTRPRSQPWQNCWYDTVKCQ
jgi:hypothetical protein